MMRGWTLWTTVGLVVAASFLGGGAVVHAQGGAVVTAPAGMPGTALGGGQAGGTTRYTMNITIIAEDRDLRAVAREIERKTGVNIYVDPGIEEVVSVRLVNLPWREVLKVVARDAGVEIEQRTQRLLVLTKPPRVSMVFHDTDIRAVLGLLARNAGKNIVIADGVRARVSLNLNNVDWWRALQTIVKTAGFVAVEDGKNLIRVVEPSSLKKTLSTTVHTLKYIRPPENYRAIISSQADKDKTAGALFLANTANPKGLEDFTLLKALQQIVRKDDGESIEYNRESNSFIVHSTDTTHRDVEKLLKKIDVEPDQVFVSVKFITTSNQDFWRAGLRMGDPISDPTNAGLKVGLGLSGATNRAESGVPSDASSVLGQFPFVWGNAHDFLTSFNVPAILDFSQMQVLAQFVNIDTNSKVTQSPTLLSLSDRPAVIFVGEKVPFAEQKANVDQNGAVTVTLQESDRSPQDVGFTLFVTPHVVRDTDQIILTIIPRVTRLTGTGSSVTGLERFEFRDPVTNTATFIDLPRLFDQTIVTNLLIRDGQTAVIGGLMQESVLEVEERIPILSSIPIIGNLFVFEHKDYKQENQIIFITPTIVRSSAQSSELFKRQYQVFQENDFFYNKYMKEEASSTRRRPKGARRPSGNRGSGSATKTGASGPGLGAEYGEPSVVEPALPDLPAQPALPAVPAPPAAGGEAAPQPAAPGEGGEAAPAPEAPEPAAPAAPADGGDGSAAPSPSGEQPGTPSIEPAPQPGTDENAAVPTTGSVETLLAAIGTQRGGQRLTYHGPENANQCPRA